MNIPMSWLKAYVNIDCDLKEFDDSMTMSGSKVEAVTRFGNEFCNVIVGKILEVNKHPDADKLVICTVDVGSRTLTIVTGAPNVEPGQYVPVATDGAVLADGKRIKNSKLRGIESQGMMCGIDELGYTRAEYPEAPENGIYVFPEEQELGADALEILQIKEDIVEFEITSNRSDCFSVIGIAREAAATFDKKLNYPVIAVKEEAGGDVNDFVKVEIKNPDLCPRYMARVIKNVKIEPSPLWMRHRLISAGIRPINNIVDITNYVMLELGQPIHAFDIGGVKDGHIIVRNAEDNETIVTLDGVTRKLDSTMLVISDPEKAVAIAGVMGGENSKVTGDSGAVLLESANFYGPNIRVTSKKLGLRTDASGKYEKGLDPNLSMDAVNRCAQLVLELGAGEVVKGYVDCYPVKREGIKVEFYPDNINRLIGINIDKKRMDSLLNRLEIGVSGNFALPPTFRPDIQREVDISEEIARLYGYDNIETTLCTGNAVVGGKNPKQHMEDIIKDTMVSLGYSESMTFSFESPKVFDKLNLPDSSPYRNAVRINNPLGEDFSVMRTLT
ncbi:MAG: phenylalanine--tRNA ligase subunit beta, partial [Clostridiales bacterium]|nr:phenylalanine--tRNA ligase subunit beta [Clostridiales bacterium]